MELGISAKRRGFSIIELIVVVGVIAAISGTALVFTRSLSNQGDLRAAAQTVAAALHTARAETLAANGDSAWGLYVQSGQATVFKGSTYAARVASSSQFYALPASVTASGTVEYDLAKFYASTTAGTTTLSIKSPAATTTVTVNGLGIVSF